MNLSFSNFLGACLIGLTAAFALPAQAAVSLGNLPLWFEDHPTSGDSTARFIAHGRDAEFAITPSGAEFTLRQASGHQSTVRMTFVGAEAGTQPVGDDALAGKINYLLGQEPAQWRTGVSTCGKVRLENIYPGVNVVYYGNQEKLEYDFDLAAGVNPNVIAIHFDGAESLSVNAAGELVVQLDGGQIVQHRPVAYQMISGVQTAVKAGYQILDSHTAAFAVGSFDAARPLVIDPILAYSTFFGGNYGEIAWAIATDPVDNSIYIAGQTFSTLVSNGPPVLAFATPNAYSTNYDGGILNGDAFVAKIDATGTNLLYCTYLGGKVDDVAFALAVDSAGHAYVAGTTDSTNFPVTNAVVYGTFNGKNISGQIDVHYGYFPNDGFVAELSTNGSSLIYSTYLGGNSSDKIFGLAVDPAGDAFVTGATLSTNFPVTANALLKHLVCTNDFYLNANGFVSEIAAGGKQLLYSTYLGGTNFDFGRAIAYNNNRVFIAGYTLSTNFVWTNGLAACRYLNGFATNISSASDGFVTMFSLSPPSTNFTLQYSTFLGSSNDDTATGIAADSLGNAYVVGWTTSTNFPSTANGVQLSSFVHTNTTGIVFATNAFLTQITWNGSTAGLGYSRTFGGEGLDIANGVTLDASGNIFIVGQASSTNFPVTANNLFGSLRATNSSPNPIQLGGSDVFVTVVKADFSALLYSAYLGGNLDDFGYGIAVDSADNAYVTGRTLSTNFPAVGTWSTGSPALHRIRDGTNDAFIAKIIMASTPPLTVVKSGPSVQVSWPLTGQATTNFVNVQTSTNLLKTNWITLTNPLPVLTNGTYIYTITPTNPVEFFRLHQF